MNKHGCHPDVSSANSFVRETTKNTRRIATKVTPKDSQQNEL